MKPYYQDKYAQIYHGDCREILPQLDKVSAIVTDPPYELNFMGKKWDNSGVSFQAETWRILREACKPGAMLLSFGGTRTFHRIAVAIEGAGWEIRDTIMWVYGSGFPKSLDISKAIDKQFGVEREVIGQNQYVSRRPNGNAWADIKLEGAGDITSPTTPEAQLWNGYGTALKPAYEPILVCMNPIDGTFANNALKHGVAGLNIAACRVEGKLDGDPNRFAKTDGGWGVARFNTPPVVRNTGRFPANIIHDGSQEVMELFPNCKGMSGGGKHKDNYRGGMFGSIDCEHTARGDSGSAARFFYCAKSSKAERNKGCEGIYSLKENTPLEVIGEIEKALASS